MSVGWQGALEHAQREVTAAIAALDQHFTPERDISLAGAAIADLLAAIYDALDDRDDPLAAIERARATIDQAKEALSRGGHIPALHAAFASLDAARAPLDLALGAIRQQPPARRSSAHEPPVTASQDLPQLHEVRRASLRPILDLPMPPAPPPELPVPLPRPRTFEELDQTLAQLARAAEERETQVRAALEDREAPTPLPVPEIPPGFDSVPIQRLSAGQQVVMRTRELVEEVAMVGLQRAPLLGDPWRVALVLEHRMFRAIDAVASLGATAVAAIEGLAMDSPVKDAPHLFGAAMTLGCLQGRDAWAAAERIYFAFERLDPDVQPALATAAILAPHPELPRALRTLLAARDARHRALAIRVLAHRGWVTEDELSAGCQDEDVVAAQAMLVGAMRRLPAAFERAHSVLLSPDPPPELLDAARRAAMLGGSGPVGEHLRAAAVDEDTAALYLALWGEQFDAAQLLERAQQRMSMGDLYALGFTGYITAVPTLLEALGHDDEQVALTAAFALDRLTGAELYEDLELDAEDIDLDVPPDPDVGEPPARRLVHEVSDPRDLPPEPAKDTLWLPSTDAQRWRSWWQEHGSDLSSARRWRRGKPFSPLVLVDELDTARCPPAERRHLQLELMIRSGRAVMLDPVDFVVQQEAALRLWRETVTSGSHAGSWHRPDPR